MRVFTWILLIITVLALAVFGYGYYGLRVQTGEMSAVVTPAANALEQFEALRAQMDNESLTGRVYRKEALGNPEDYVFVTYTVRVKNVGLIPAEWIELVITPGESDILEVDIADAQVLGAMREGDLKTVILQKGDGSDTARAAQVQYYAFGSPYAVNVK